MSPRNDATDSYVGYIHQGRYALVALLESPEADAVSVETDDDVVLEGRDVTLSQLKHSLGTPRDLTLANVGFWKALRIWAEREVAADASSPAITTRYCFVTVADIAEGDALAGAARGAGRSPSGDQTLVDALTAEAQRVVDERAVPRPPGVAAPHVDRAAPCEAFLALSPEQRLGLVTRMAILPRSFRVVDVEARIAAKLDGIARADVRPRVAERLVEWWDAQVARALTGRRDRRIAKEEVAGRTNDLLVEYREDSLPDHFSILRPTPEELAQGRASNIARQIELVRGGGRRIDRAVVARWRARGQRDRWLLEDVSRATILEQFDDRLREAWAERYGPMCDDCANAGEDERCEHGLRILDWAHSGAPIEVPPPRRDWQFGYYAHGMLHQFADHLEVGWHPDFRERLGPAEAAASPPDMSAAKSAADGTGPQGRLEAAVPAADARVGRRKPRTPTGRTDPPQNSDASADARDVRGARARTSRRRRSSGDAA